MSQRKTLLQSECNFCGAKSNIDEYNLIKAHLEYLVSKNSITQLDYIKTYTQVELAFFNSDGSSTGFTLHGAFKNCPHV
jgi:hypothetical protein